MTAYFRFMMTEHFDDDDILGEGVCVSEIAVPGGEAKKAKKEHCLKIKADRETDEYNRSFYRPPKRKVEDLLPLSFKFVGFDANGIPVEEVMGHVKQLFFGVESVALGKLRPNQEKNPVYNGWVNFLGVGHCKKAIRAVQERKFGSMKVVKIGRTKELACAPMKLKIKKPPKRRTHLTCWGQKLLPNYRKFANDVFMILKF